MLNDLHELRKLNPYRINKFDPATYTVRYASTAAFDELKRTFGIVCLVFLVVTTDVQFDIATTMTRSSNI